MPGEISTKDLLNVPVPTGKLLGIQGYINRSRLSSAIVESVEEELVHPYNSVDIEHDTHGKLYFAVPAFGEKYVETAFRLAGSSLLGNEGRINTRIWHTGNAGYVSRDTSAAFSRFEVGALNDDGYKPWAEKLMSGISASKLLKSVKSLGDIGAVVNGLTSVGVPILKLLTRDSVRAKATSLVVQPLLAAVTGGITATLGIEVLPVPFYLDSGRLEGGLDMGDAIADIGQFLAYLILLDHPEVNNKRKVNIAKGFLTMYTKGEGPDGPRPSPLPQEDSSTTKLSLVDQGVNLGRRLERVVDVPGVGEVLSTVHTIKSISRDKNREQRSMRERVNDILARADHEIAQAQSVINTNSEKAFSTNLEFHDASMRLAVWKYRKGIASMLSELGSQSEVTLAESKRKTEEKKLKKSRRSSSARS